jgi:hypothetical protein
MKSHKAKARKNLFGFILHNRKLKALNHKVIKHKVNLKNAHKEAAKH